MLFSDVPEGSVDPMNTLKLRSDADRSPHKVDLGAGVYRDEEANYYEFPAIKKVRTPPNACTDILMNIIQAKAILASINPGHDVRPLSLELCHAWTTNDN